MKSDNQDADSGARLFIDGGLANSDSDATFPVINPSTGRGLFEVAAGSDRDVSRAVVSAHRAFGDGRWSEAPPSFRKKTLYSLADAIAAQAHTLDVLDAAEMGKPVREQLFNAASAANLMRFYAEAVDKVAGDTFASDRNSLVVQRRVPRGVFAAIVPWNFPTFNAVLKVAPALAAGNCVVLKPSELASRSAVRLAEFAVRAGLPEGVLNVVPGLGETVGRALGLHPLVDAVTFTGSTEVGRQMLQYAGQSNMKFVIAECGGKSPHVLFDDGVDLDAASDAIAQRLVTNQGQICSVGSRLLVQRSIEQPVLERIAARVARVVIGDALDPQTTFGPVASAAQCARVMQYIEGGTREGAELVTGGRRIHGDSGGFFVEPTVFRNVSASAQIAQQEIFGPVLSTISFDDEAEALHIANGTIYGLTATVWTTKLSTGLRVAKGIRSSVRINATAPQGEGAGHAASYEPWGQSGIGTEGGLAGMESYLRRQLITINHA